MDGCYFYSDSNKIVISVKINTKHVAKNVKTALFTLTFLT